jgi:tetratricopeptide (TPR) repeat protein
MSFSRIGPKGTLVVFAFLFPFLSGEARAENDDAQLRKKALALNEVTGQLPMRGQILTLIEDAAGSKKLLAQAVTLAKDKEQPFNYNAAYILGRTAQELGDLGAGELFYRLCADQATKLRSGEKAGLAYGGLIDMYFDAKQYDKSEKVCKEFLELDEQDDTIKLFKSLVMRRLIQALARQEKIEEATKLVDNLIKRRPGDWMTLELKGWVQREAGDFAAAAKTFEDVLERVRKSKDLTEEEKTDYTERFRYMLSGIYVDAEQIDKATEQLQALLKDDENNPTYNNDLGYIWADHDMNLEESERLIRKAIEEERKQIRKTQPDIKAEDIKDNPSYLDSLGWVLFKQKKYKEAKDYLIAATKGGKEGEHLEIYEHLGDTHLALGEKAEAVAAWKKALEVAGPTKREQARKAEVEKKIKAANP